MSQGHVLKYAGKYIKVTITQKIHSHDFREPLHEPIIQSTQELISQPINKTSEGGKDKFFIFYYNTQKY